MKEEARLPGAPVRETLKGLDSRHNKAAVVPISQEGEGDVETREAEAKTREVDEGGEVLAS